MVDISEEVLSTLKCSECDNYLSCSPVMVKANGDSICGRCPLLKIADHSLIRNNAYEKLAKVVRFPCRFHIEGCTTKLAMGEVKDHEEDCNFRKWLCPTLPIGSCNWSGPRSKIYQHFKATHGDLVTRSMVEPYQFKYDNSKHFEKNVITAVFGFLFLVQIRSTASQIWQCVRLIGPSKLASQFKYHFSVTKDEYKLIVEKIVSRQKKYNENGENFVDLNVNGLMFIFGSLENMLFSLQITRSEINCMKCDDTIVSSTKYDCLQEAKYCDDCHPGEINDELPTEKRTYCQNKTDGCKYEGNEIDLNKHAYWFCTFGANKCQFCNLFFKSCTRIDHFKKCDKLTTHYSNIAVTEITLSENNFIEVETHDEIFYCILYIKGKYLWMQIVSQSTREVLDKFDIEVTMDLDKQLFKNHKLQKLTNNNNNNDWREKFNVNNNGPYKVKINIKKLN